MRWKLRVSDSKIYSCGNWVADCPVLKTSFSSDPKEMSTSSPSSSVKENLDNKNKIFGSVGYYKTRLVAFVYLILNKLRSYA